LGEWIRKELPEMQFVKLPINPWAVPIYYNLQKSDNSNIIKGDYEAQWHFNEDEVMKGTPETSNIAKFKLF
jgi:hypothetical protein